MAWESDNPARAMHPFTIPTDGDEFERRWWPQWTSNHFPSYETFWVARVVPLTYRVKNRQNIRFRPQSELSADGYTEEDVAVAQLHYTLLMHLGRVFELVDDAHAFTVPDYMANRHFGRDAFFEAFARLTGASDVADELLARRAKPGTYDAWNETDGGNARRAWRKANPDPLEPVRAYRHRLVHGRVVPEIFLPVVNAQSGQQLGDVLLYPRVDKVASYLDWRVAFAEAGSTTPSPDFAEAAIIAADAWGDVVTYVEQAWRTHLLQDV
jgi:hypothetical protein